MTDHQNSPLTENRPPAERVAIRLTSDECRVYELVVTCMRDRAITPGFHEYVAGVRVGLIAAGFADGGCLLQGVELAAAEIGGDAAEVGGVS